MLPLKDLEFGARRNGTVREVETGREPKRPRCAVLRIEGQDFVVCGVEHEIEPLPGTRVLVEYTQGGPTGAYFRVISGEQQLAA